MIFLSKIRFKYSNSIHCYTEPSQIPMSLLLLLAHQKSKSFSDIPAHLYPIRTESSTKRRSCLLISEQRAVSSCSGSFTSNGTTGSGDGLWNQTDKTWWKERGREKKEESREGTAKGGWLKRRNHLQQLSHLWVSSVSLGKIWHMKMTSWALRSFDGHLM